MTRLRNVLALVFADSVAGWRRDFHSFAPALAAMTLLLTLAGVVAMLAYTGTRLVQNQLSEAAVLHAYLADADESSVSGLEATLRGDHRVVSVTYVSKEQALKDAQARTGLADLASASGNNPFPASLSIRARDIADLPALDKLVRADANLDPQLQTSYDAGAYDRVNQLVLVLVAGGLGLLALLALVGVGITGASMRGVVVARREELRAFDLLGASGWMVRGPFVTQGALTGIVAGVLAAVTVLGVYSAEAEATRTSVLQWLPAVATETALAAAGLLALSGLMLGAVSSLTELRRL